MKLRMNRREFIKRSTAAVATVVLACAGIGAAVAATGSSNVACATTPAHTVAVDGSPVSTTPGDVQCATAPTVTVTVTDPGTTTAPAATTAPATTTTSSSAPTFASETTYTQNRPAFTAQRTVPVSSGSELKAAIANLQPGDLVEATADFTVSGETDITARLPSPAVIDLSGHQVKFVYSGGQQLPGVWIKDASNIRIYGGDVSTADTGGTCIYSVGAQNVLWWGFVAHDCGAHGVALIPNQQAITGLDIEGEVYKAGENLAWDPHAEKGCGLHGAYLGNGSYAFSGNRIALYVHDQPSGAAIQYGSNSSHVAPANNTIYLEAARLTMAAQTETAGNAIQFWGRAGQSADVKYLEADDTEGYALLDSMYSGANLSGVTVEYGRATNTNLNPRYAGKNPWMTNAGVVYKDVQPAP